MRIEAILWDMDGVLIDSEQQKYLAWKKAIKNNGGGEFKPDDYKELVGLHSREIARILVKKGFISADKTKRVIRETDEIYESQGIHKVKPIESSIRLLRNMHELYLRKGIPKHVVVSSDTPENIVHNLKKYGLKQHFEFFISVHSKKPKPNPTGYIEAAERLGLKPNQCIVIEDTPAGVQAGRRAGMRVVGRSSEWISRQKLKNAGAFMTADNLDELTTKFVMIIMHK